MKLGCVNTVRKMSNNWSRLVASQGCGQLHGQNVTFVTFDWGWNKYYIWIEHLLPAANFFKVILVHISTIFTFTF